MMRLTLTRHGGFAGLRPPPLVVDSSTLPTVAAAEIERLAATVGPASAAPSSAQPDRFSYTLVIARDDGSEATHSFDEANASPPLNALVRALQNTRK